jgi:hypothetical protein
MMMKFGPDFLACGAHRLDREADAVFEGAAPLVVALVGLLAR